MPTTRQKDVCYSSEMCSDMSHLRVLPRLFKKKIENIHLQEPYLEVSSPCKILFYGVSRVCRKNPPSLYQYNILYHILSQHLE